MIAKNITRILSIFATSVAIVCGLVSCRDEQFSIDDIKRVDNLPIDIEVILPEATRGLHPMTKFEGDEIIHIEGRFLMDDNTTEIRYGAFRYETGTWKQYGGQAGSTEVERFTWPNNAVSAEFKAYFLPGGNSLLTPTNNPENQPPTLLSSLAGTTGVPDTDPLIAVSGEQVKYGHTIILKFTHLCAYLIVEEMPAGIASDFWFTQNGPDGEVSPTFYNAFRLTLDPDKSLNFQFTQVPDTQYDNAVYVAGKSESQYIDGKEKASFGVFLAPGQYDSFVIGYPGATSMVNYMTYAKSGPNPQPDGSPDANPDNILQANGVYTFNISKSAGIEINTPPDGDVWDEYDDPIYNVEAEKFLYSICYPAEYWVDDVLILEPIGNGTRLNKNVNMQWAEYSVFEPSDVNNHTWFLPDLGRGNTFDGGGHYIWNLGSPLFNTVNGVIKNLGISNANITLTTMDQYKPEGYEPVGDEPEYFDLSRRGAICNYVQEGTLQNIRVKSKVPSSYQPGISPDLYEDIFTINAFVYANSSQEAHNIGCLFGSNLNGTISGVTIMCDMTLNLENAPDTEAIPTLSVGGIIGQNVNMINNIGTQNNPSISIHNSCEYHNASYYIGGILGYHSGGTVDNVILPSISIDSRASTGFTSYIGGAVGGLSNASEGGYLLNCNVGGTVFAGKSQSDNEYPGSSYTGGLAGECYESFIVNGCRTTVNVYGPYGTNYVSSGTNYATGGMFGRILKLNVPNLTQTPESIGNNIASGLEVRGPSYIGNFAGIVPQNETWESDYAPQRNIVTSHQNGDNELENIGTSM